MYTVHPDEHCRQSELSEAPQESEAHLDLVESPISHAAGAILQTDALAGNELTRQAFHEDCQ